MTDDPKRMVAEGYDRMAGRFAEWQKGITGSPRLEWVEELVRLLPPQPAILELASGAAVRSTRRLAEIGDLTGVDISAEQVRRARERCPDATFIHGDITEVEFPQGAFDAVVCLYSFNHVPRVDLPPLVGRIGVWLRPGGYFLANFGASGGEGVEEDWLGVPMFFASYTPGENLELVREAGLELIREELATIHEPAPDEGEGKFHWVLARKPE